jgi:hypothetical protein
VTSVADAYLAMRREEEENEKSKYIYLGCGCQLLAAIEQSVLIRR